MSKPAARLGDMTMHGGTIVAGMPTVLIGGMPAARLGDMHVCPMATPGTPPIPHVGGPVTLGSAGVMIGGVPAARLGDMCVCTGPPDSIAMGCPTVMIGEVGAGSASGGGAGGGGGAAGARASAAAATIDTGVSTTKEEHWIEFEFVDSAGLPVAGVPYAFTDPDGVDHEGTLRTDGALRADGVSEGEGEVVLRSVHAAQWDTDRAGTDDKLTLTADVIGFEDGTPAQVQIFERDLSGADTVVADLNTQVRGGAIEVKWRYEYPPDLPDEDHLRPEGEDRTFSAPDYYFEVIIGSCTTRSPVLLMVDAIEIEVATESGEAISGQPYVLITGTGERRTGTLDGNGKAKEKDVPISDCIVRIPELPDLEAIQDAYDVTNTDNTTESDGSPPATQDVPPGSLCFRLCDFEGDPLQGAAYSVILEHQEITGTTDRSGWIEPFETGNADEGTLQVGRQTFKLTFSSPKQGLALIQTALNALGFEAGEVTGKMNIQTEAAIRHYQRDRYLEVTGEVNSITEKLLLEDYGS